LHRPSSSRRQRRAGIPSHRAGWLVGGRCDRRRVGENAGPPKTSTKVCFENALLYLSAATAEAPVLTANRQEFDIIQQIAPEDRSFIFGRKGKVHPQLNSHLIEWFQMAAVI